MNLLLLIFSVFLLFLFIVLVYFYLKKDQELLELRAKYSNLEKLEDNQSEQNKRRDDYMAMMVHELRSPLSVIKGSADLVIREDQALSTEQRFTLLGQIKQSSSDLLAIVNDILDVSKIESGRLEIRKVVGNIDKLLGEEAEYYMALAREKEILVKTELHASEAKVEFDEDRVKHVLNNLLSNALKFTENEGTVVVSSRVVDNRAVEVTVADNGRGIQDDIKGKLFNKFVQADSNMVAKDKGTGLGLVIAKGIIEAHGGAIWVEDNEPKGARFVFTIPLAV